MLPPALEAVTEAMNGGSKYLAHRPTSLPLKIMQGRVNEALQAFRGGLAGVVADAKCRAEEEGPWDGEEALRKHLDLKLEVLRGAMEAKLREQAVPDEMVEGALEADEVTTQVEKDVEGLVGWNELRLKDAETEAMKSQLRKNSELMHAKDDLENYKQEMQTRLRAKSDMARSEQAKSAMLVEELQMQLMEKEAEVKAAAEKNASSRNSEGASEMAFLQFMAEQKQKEAAADRASKETNELREQLRAMLEQKAHEEEAQKMLESAQYASGRI